jgi:ABC-type phosphate/phosphonate transport system permease subunit
MVETVFLALVATTLALPFSVLVSFFAARNLMLPIRTELGGLLLGFILLPLGWALGTLLLAPAGAFMVNLG